jgi:hypothetical protein
VIRCPACGESVEDGAAACSQCHLSTELFGPVREAAGDPEGNPRAADTIRELLQAAGLDDTSTEGDNGETSGARLGTSASFPAPSAWPTRPPAVSQTQPTRVLPALPPAGSVPVWKQQIDEYLQIGRRQGIDLAEFHRRSREALVTDDPAELEKLSRELFVHLAASLVDELNTASARRQDLSGLVETEAAGRELEECRAALGTGNLAHAQLRLKTAEQTLSALEVEWATVQILVTECDLIALVITELGGDPRPGLGPRYEGARLARLGRRADAEPVLARATSALWSIASSLVVRDLQRLAREIARTRDGSAGAKAAVAEVREFAGAVRRRNYGVAVQAYRRLRLRLDTATSAAG